MIWWRRWNRAGAVCKARSRLAGGSPSRSRRRVAGRTPGGGAASGRAGRLPAAGFWNAQVYPGPAEASQAYQAILGFTPRLLLASLLAYLVGEFLNGFVLAKLKLATQGRWLWVRTIG